MKIASTVCRYLLGVMFTIFGANGFFHFLQQPPPSSVFAIQFLTVLVGSHFIGLIFLLQLIAGILLLADRFVPLALVTLAAILTNILDYHLTMDPGGIAPGLVATILWIVTAQNYRRNFRGLLAAKAESAHI
jgi:putative oxidoreductase